MESSPRPEPVRIFLVGLSERLARSLARYVSSDPRVSLSGVAPSVALASILLPAMRPDLAVVDWSVLDNSTPGAVNALRREHPRLCVFLAANESEPYRSAAALAGADAVISKDMFARDIEALLRGFFADRYAAPEVRNA